MLRQIIKRRGVAILDGGMGTALEQRGIEEPWSAGYRLDEPTVRKAVLDSYGSFLQAGADLLTVNTYNLSTPALANDFFSSGGDSSVLSQRRDALLKAAGDGGAKAAVANMFRANVEVARTAVAAHMAETTADGGGPLRVEPLLVASMGCYGTCIRGRAETANREGEAGADDAALLREPAYGRVSKDALVAFHTERVALALANGVRLLAFETVPDLVEAEAIAEVMQATTGGAEAEVEAWVTFTCGTSDRVDNGALFDDCVAALNGVHSIVGVGINCTAPHLVVPLLDIAAAAQLPEHPKILVCYPNSGETYLARALQEGETEHWKFCNHDHHAESAEGAVFADDAAAWYAAGARVIGGCCRVTAADIAQLSAKYPPLLSE